MHNIQPDSGRLPRHVGIIMDGNGRWARRQGKPRTFGHTEGLKAAKRVVTYAADIGLEYLTLYTFSTENWVREKSEVSFLMRLIQRHLKKELKFYRTKNIRVMHSGYLPGLPQFVQDEIRDVVRATNMNGGLTVNLAINYGGKDEILRALKRILAEREKPAPDSIDEAWFTRYLDCPDIPDVDLIIRTGGDCRISNFMLWRASYAEFYSSRDYWPDWDEDHFREALTDFQNRERKFGG